MSNVYTEKGYKNRKDYVDSLAEEYGADVEQVRYLADMLGASEDFDGLVSAVESMDELGYATI